MIWIYSLIFSIIKNIFKSLSAREILVRYQKYKKKNVETRVELPESSGGEGVPVGLELIFNELNRLCLEFAAAAEFCISNQRFRS